MVGSDLVYAFLHVRCYLKVVGKAVKRSCIMNEKVLGELVICKPVSFPKLHEQDISIKNFTQVMILI